MFRYWNPNFRNFSEEDTSSRRNLLAYKRQSARQKKQRSKEKIKKSKSSLKVVNVNVLKTNIVMTTST